MPRLFIVAISYLLASHICFSQQLTSQQEAWLYRIVQKTPILKQNWNDSFHFNTLPFTTEKRGRKRLDYNAISYYQTHNPQSLQIDYDEIKSSSQGLITEATIKLTLWELNEELKKCINQHIDCNKALHEQLTSPLKQYLPKRGSKKRHAQIINIVIHPSLPIFKKIEELNDSNVDGLAQKNLLNTWSQIISDYSFNRSHHFFNILTGGQSLNSTTFLAAGEGSGTAGLLYEWELNPNDSTKTWYGKGIGLFTYQVRNYKDELRLQTHLTKQLKLDKDEDMALHTSLWGLDSSFKPMLIVTDDSVSYHLFAISAKSGLSPDRHLSNGISHVERIEEHRQRNIITPMKEIQSNSLLDKAYKNKQLTEAEITLLESEIDTLRKYEPDNINAIDYKKRLIDAKLSTLSKKEQRINELERSLTNKYKSISNAEKKLMEMEKLLGPSPQEWTKEDDIYTFKNGVTFDPTTQDLVFPARENERVIDVRLVSAGYTLEGKKKDEVQAYITITLAQERAIEPEKSQYTSIDTTLIKHYFPDEFVLTNLQLDSSTIAKTKTFNHYKFTIEQLAISDKLKSHSSNYTNRKREYQLPLTIDAQNRKTLIQFKSAGDTLLINCKAYADPVATRLSVASSQLREHLKVTSSSQSNNKYLIALRAMHALKAILATLDISYSDCSDENTYHNLQLNQKEFEIIFDSIKDK
ncbi:hypothetical protein [Carboxylicivirga marina]|uniref:Uncharacterized protein n=1 Tax=Carboxylicivirga marina TaxID=2800988 RepID=A0ABS1HHQ7_9BACT|nr:hypothetical protein [Carboxylicivirga marina]MBK3517169.1 hypothetical protein [Carboxylicivirga marina]